MILENELVVNRMDVVVRVVKATMPDVGIAACIHLKGAEINVRAEFRVCAMTILLTTICNALNHDAFKNLWKCL